MVEIITENGTSIIEITTGIGTAAAITAGVEAANSAALAAVSEANAAASEVVCSTKADEAAASALSALTSKDSAASSAAVASSKAVQAANSAISSKGYSDLAESAKDAASDSEAAALVYRNEAEHFRDDAQLIAGGTLIASGIQLADGRSVEDAQGTTDTHIASSDNPHSVTKEQVGLGSVDNTADMDKPISTAQAVRFTAVESVANSALPSTGTAVSATNLADKSKQLDVVDALSISGYTITLKKGDGTTESVTVPASSTPAEILAAIKTVDGTGSGLDSDFLDGHDSEYFASVQALVDGLNTKLGVNQQAKDAAKLGTARKLSFTGTVTGSGMFDGSQDIVINTSCSGCTGGCTGSCTGSCSGCTGSCTGSCSGCTGTCTGGCTGTCSACSGSCDGGCGSCSGGVCSGK